ncbi:MAG TPA: LPS export ABC transporter periplasmic protein LptC [Woeseiaceae bacterium]|nr:LPS export ABC transporter periplasmic protein LptC [Woeseiaceae bacterium]
MISARNGVVLTTLVAAALGSWYLARQDRAQESADAVDVAQRGYYLKSARILGTGEDGSLLYEIRAERAEQKDSDSIDFINVLINYSPTSDVPWSVNADTATIERQRNRVLLRGHVRAISTEGFSGTDTEIRTQYLELDPEAYLAETDERVQIRIGARSLTATGMLASLKDNTLELKSNVSGKFVP